MSETLQIGDRRVGDGHVFVIAEAGVNHNGDLALAHRLVDVAAAAGADAVKFQTFKAERLVSTIAPKAGYQMEHTDRDESQFAMLQALELSEPAHRELMDHCRAAGSLFLSTPFDEACADFLAGLGMPAFKFSSGDLTNHPFLQHVARFGRPLIVSTGMSTLEEVRAAVAAILETGHRDVALLHCVSSYPTPYGEVNLRAMDTLRAEFGLPVGFSDHTEGTAIALAAVARGACIVEKHFTTDRHLPGPDHQASLEPDELTAMIREIRAVSAALGDGIKRPVACELPNQPIGRKSLHWSHGLVSGATATADDFIALRPGTGLEPSRIGAFAGRQLARAVTGGAMVEEAHFL